MAIWVWRVSESSTAVIKDTGGNFAQSDVIIQKKWIITSSVEKKRGWKGSFTWSSSTHALEVTEILVARSEISGPNHYRLITHQAWNEVWRNNSKKWFYLYPSRFSCDFISFWASSSELPRNRAASSRRVYWTFGSPRDLNVAEAKMPENLSDISKKKFLKNF